MRPVAFVTALSVGVAVAATAWPCGSPFGGDFVVEPSQRIVVAHHAGVETYVFGPSFCGKSTDFGLVLPVPQPLVENPSLASAELYPELDVLTAPNVEEVEVCEDAHSGCMGTAAKDGAASPGGNQQGVDVISAGRVGQFDFVQLQADTVLAFTDWLDSNGYPHESSSDTLFAHYVSKGWYFVAFKVTASPTAPPAGYQLCGDLGPISLSFYAAAPVIPARIAAAAETGSVIWDVVTVGPDQRTVPSDGQVTAELRYAATFQASDASTYPSVAELAAEGDRVTLLRLRFWPSELDDDITLTVGQPQDFRATDRHYVVRSCDGCALRAGETTRLPVGELTLWLGALWFGCRPRRRPRA